MRNRLFPELKKYTVVMGIIDLTELKTHFQEMG